MRLCTLLICCLLLCSCTVSNSFKETVEEKSYHLQGYQTQTIHNSAFKNEITYVVNDELELAKVLQKQYEQGENITYFQSAYDMDLDKLSSYLSHLNPFDIKIELQTNTYEDEHGAIHKQQVIDFINYDSFYEDTLAYAKQNLNTFIKEGMNIHEKIKAIHDYLIEHVVYDKTQLEQKNLKSNAFLAYGALFEKKAVCSGYARAFMIYAMLLDIPCIYVTSDSIDHAWNLVYDGNEWVYVDVTWDDLDDNMIRSTYLEKDSQAFYQDGKHVLDHAKQESYYRKLGYEFFGR